jgi:Tol biopolymer transport system component
VTTRANGIVTITATSEGKKGTATVQVITTSSSRLVFSGSEERFGVGRLYSAALGGAPHPVLGSRVLPGWTLTSPSVSPDGQRIAFSAARDAEAYVFAVNTDGTALRQLTNGADEGGPVWSPDGARIAYVSWPAGSDADIWVMNADGSGAINLTGGMGFTDQHSADWSADLVDGSRIAFVDGDFFGGRIVTMRPDGSDVRQVTAGAPWTDSEPAWSPDGATLVFIREGPGTAGADLWLVDASGANPRALLSLAVTQANPAWSRDLGLIAFSSIHAPGSLYDVYTVTESGGALTHRTSGAAYAVHPAWGR